MIAHFPALSLRRFWRPKKGAREKNLRDPSPRGVVTVYTQ